MTTGRRTDSSRDGVVLTTHKVVINARDEAAAERLVEALTNDGYSVRREIHRLVRHEGFVHQEVERV